MAIYLCDGVKKKPPIDLRVSSERSERVVKYIHAPNHITKLGPSA
jgi:hypothetical protein